MTAISITKGIIIFLLTITVLLYSSMLFAGEATLSWNPPTTNTDGTTLIDLAGYRVYYGTSSGNYSQVINVGNVTIYTVNNLTEGVTYYFAVTAYNTFRNESEYSNEVSKTIASKTIDPTLTVNKAGTGAGTVTSSPIGINCGNDCSESFKQGTVVELTPTPDSQSTFYGWTSGGCNGAGICFLNLNTNSFVTATFNLLPPIASFDGSPTSGALPLYVSFTDTSTNIPNVWSWSFGDGKASRLQNPGYTYKKAGTYTVSLTVSNANATDTDTKNSYITVSPCQNKSIRIIRTSTIYYTTLQAAYNAAVTGDIIELHALDFTENLSFNRNISVTFKAGYDCGYRTNPSQTTIIGTIGFLDGIVILENIALE